VTQQTRQVAVATLVGQGIPRRNISFKTPACSSDQPKGTVVQQDPVAATSVSKQTQVTLCLSAGPQAVPNVIGKQEAAAVRIIEAAGFKATVRDYTGSTTKPKGTVIDQAPTAGKGHTAQQGSTIYIWVSTYVAPKDSDGDGLSDAEEAQYGTNPHNPDSDGDGLSDGDEVNKYHTDPLVADTDGDGYSDGAEVAAGSNPNDPNSTPQNVPPGQQNH
jgi:serine/threonine-protein kinase